VLLLGLADTIKAIFPPFRIPGFMPDFTGYNLLEDINWNEMYQMLAPNDSLAYVRNTTSVRQH